MRPVVAFVVYADPAPQGSKTTGSRKDGSRFTRESSKHVKPFRAAVRQAAEEAFAGRTPLDGPVELQVICEYARPASHYGTGRNAGKLKPSAPYWKKTIPDISKIVRAVEDAMKGVAFTDDGRVARLISDKQYAAVGQATKVRIAVIDLAEEEVTNATGSERPDRAGDRRDGSGAEGGDEGGGAGEPGEVPGARARGDASGDRPAVADEGPVGQQALV